MGSTIFMAKASKLMLPHIKLCKKVIKMRVFWKLDDSLAKIEIGKQQFWRFSHKTCTVHISVNSAWFCTNFFLFSSRNEGLRSYLLNTREIPAGIPVLCPIYSAISREPHHILTVKSSDMHVFYLRLSGVFEPSILGACVLFVFSCTWVWGQLDTHWAEGS